MDWNPLTNPFLSIHPSSMVYWWLNWFSLTHPISTQVQAHHTGWMDVVVWTWIFPLQCCPIANHCGYHRSGISMVWYGMGKLDNGWKLGYLGKVWKTEWNGDGWESSKMDENKTSWGLFSLLVVVSSILLFFNFPKWYIILWMYIAFNWKVE